MQLCERDGAWLTGPARAVVVAPRREAGGFELAAEIAPRTRDLGVILPVAPVHWLLLHEPGTSSANDAPRFPALVFTSANASEEPTLHDDASARARLSALADLVLTHDRAVARPNDDPVVRSAAGGPIPIRLSRSTAPGTIITDVGSVKGFLAETLPALLPPGVRWVGSHPMAGSHERGLAFASVTSPG